MITITQYYGSTVYTSKLTNYNVEYRDGIKKQRRQDPDAVYT